MKHSYLDTLQAITPQHSNHTTNGYLTSSCQHESYFDHHDNCALRSPLTTSQRPERSSRRDGPLRTSFDLYRGVAVFAVWPHRAPCLSQCTRQNSPRNFAGCIGLQRHIYCNSEGTTHPEGQLIHGRRPSDSDILRLLPFTFFRNHCVWS